MPFKCDLTRQNTPLSKQPCQLQPQIEYKYVNCNPQYNLPATRTDKRTTLSLQVELDGWLLNLHIVLETRTK